MLKHIYTRFNFWLQIVKDLYRVRKIDLEKTYVSTLENQNEVLNIHEIMATRPEKFPDYLLKDSYDVIFLKDLKDRAEVLDDEIRKSKCYQASYRYMRKHGSFNEMSDEEALIKYCRSFLKYCRALDRQPYTTNVFKAMPHFCRILGGDPPTVVRILGTKYCMILDGHHRLSCLYAMGERYVNVRVEGVIRKPTNALRWSLGKPMQ